MKLLISGKAAHGENASTFIETLIGTSIMAIMFASLYTGMSSGFSMVTVARENLRATQIMLNRMEGLRLYNWNQLVSSNMVPATFTESFCPLGTVGNTGLTYHATMSVTNVTLDPPATYSAGMVRRVTVEVKWISGGVERTRQMSTYVSQYGVQNYLFNN
jgi:hypothetical protein